MIPDYRPSEPSPYCGRIDEHEPHEWTRAGRTFECPGPPHGSLPYLPEES